MQGALGGCDLSAEDAYSSVAPHPTLAFVAIHGTQYSILYWHFGLWLRVRQC
jgi:hypothetical protein